nr:unnamed protein product [Digitaria exilis]
MLACVCSSQSSVPRNHGAAGACQSRGHGATGALHWRHQHSADDRVGVGAQTAQSHECGSTVSHGQQGPAPLEAPPLALASVNELRQERLIRSGRSLPSENSSSAVGART